MFAFLLCIPAIIVTSGSYVVESIHGITITYLLLGLLLVSYGYYITQKREALSMGSAERCLLLLEAWGLLYVLLSFTKVNQMMQADLTYDLSFLPRQAVYFFVLPAAILFRRSYALFQVQYTADHSPIAALLAVAKTGNQSKMAQMDADCGVDAGADS